MYTAHLWVKIVGAELVSARNIRADIKSAPTLLLLFFLFITPVHADIVTGLVGWWRFDEMTGTSTRDASGKGNTGTLNNFADPATPTSGWSAGKFNGALTFDGTNDYVSFTAISSTARTQAGWFYFFRKAGDAGQHRFLFYNLYQHSANNYFYNAGTNDYFNFRPEINTWYHIVFTFTDKTNDLTAKLYVNGVLYNITDQVGAITISNVNTIGRNLANSTFEGIIDDVRIYDRALSQADIVQLYQNGGPTVIHNATIPNLLIE